MDLSFPTDNMGYSDIASMGLVLNAFAKVAQEHAPYDTTLCTIATGFNRHSGYVYIAFDNGVSIASCFGQKVVYLAGDDDREFDSYDAALLHTES